MKDKKYLEMSILIKIETRHWKKERAQHNNLPVHTNTLRLGNAKFSPGVNFYRWIISHWKERNCNRNTDRLLAMAIQTMLL